MTLEEIKEILKAMNSESNSDRPDDESLHIQQDALYFDFIKFIAETKIESADKIYLINSLNHLQEMAREIIKADAIDFCHWYA